jgi:hypothetical protein
MGAHDCSRRSFVPTAPPLTAALARSRSRSVPVPPTASDPLLPPSRPLVPAQHLAPCRRRQRRPCGIPPAGRNRHPGIAQVLLRRLLSVAFGPGGHRSVTVSVVEIAPRGGASGQGPQGEHTVKPDLQRRLEAAQEARRKAASPPATASQPRSAQDDPGSDPAGERRGVIDLRTVQRVWATTERNRQTAFDAAAAHMVGPRGPRSAFAHTPLAAAPLRGGGDGPEPRPTTTPLQDRCRACGGPLRLDLFDLVHAVAHLSCVDCGLLATARSPRA